MSPKVFSIRLIIPKATTMINIPRIPQSMWRCPTFFPSSLSDFHINTIKPHRKNKKPTAKIRIISGLTIKKTILSTITATELDTGPGTMVVLSCFY